MKCFSRTPVSVPLERFQLLLGNVLDLSDEACRKKRGISLSSEARENVIKLEVVLVLSKTVPSEKQRKKTARDNEYINRFSFFTGH